VRQEAQVLALDDQFGLLNPHEELRLAKNILRPLITKYISNGHQAIRSIAARFRLSQGFISLGLINGILDCYNKLAELGISTNNISYKNNITWDEIKKSINNIHEALISFKSNASTKAAHERLEIISASFSAFRNLENYEEACRAHAWVQLRQACKGNFGDKILRQNLVNAVVKLGADLVDFYIAPDEEILTNIIKEFNDKFEEAKLRENKLSYADLLIKARDALFYNSSLRQRVKQRFLHILIDEYQDTSPVQEQIISLLCENKNNEQALSPSQDLLTTIDFRHGSSLFVVGDKKQSIYGFRGADSSLFERMLNKMSQTHADTNNFTQKLLTINRRSQPEILNFINLVSSHTLRTQNYNSQEDLEPHLGDNTGIVEMWLKNSDGDLDKTTANAKICADGIAQLLASRPEINLRDITILVRRIKSATIIKKYLAGQKIAARIIGGDGFFQQQEIVDLLAALKLILDPSHELASAILFRSPLVLLPDTDFLTLTEERNKLNLLTAARALETGLLTGEGAERLKKFLDILKYITDNLHEHNLSWALDTIINNTDYAYNIGLSPHADQRWANVNKLCSIISNNNKNSYMIIQEFFEYINTNKKEPQAVADAEEDFVSIMTIHQSKGLEFNIVVIADSESSLPPNTHDFLFDKELSLVAKPRGRVIANCAPSDRDEQERFPTRFDRVKQKQASREQGELARLLYVALTRAKKELYLACSQTSFSHAPDKNSLLGLILDTHACYPEKFKHLCSIKYLPEASIYNKNIKTNYTDIEIYNYAPKIISKRIYSSTLIAPAKHSLGDFINPDVGTNSGLINGKLAHDLLAQAGSMLSSFAHSDQQTLEHLLDASARALALDMAEQELDHTRAACITTLQVIYPVISQASNIIFEMPLCYEKDNIIIEGFADLVLETKDFFGIIEFKSSAYLATHPNTHMQIFAYAQALATNINYKKPIKYTSILIGSSHAVRWQAYNNLCQQAWLDALKLWPCEVT
jgi:ATP-dependent helicase/nuclease subunit A